MQEELEHDLFLLGASNEGLHQVFIEVMIDLGGWV
jgi:hypothetical protein